MALLLKKNRYNIYYTEKAKFAAEVNAFKLHVRVWFGGHRLILFEVNDLSSLAGLLRFSLFQLFKKKF